MAIGFYECNEGDGEQCEDTDFAKNTPCRQYSPTKTDGMLSCKSAKTVIAAAVAAYYVLCGPGGLPSATLGIPIFSITAAAAEEAPLPQDPAEIDRALAEFAEQVARCWSIPAGGQASLVLKLRLLERGDVSGDPTPVSTDGIPVPARTAAIRATHRCTPYTTILSKAPWMAKRDIYLTFHPADATVTAVLTPPEVPKAPKAVEVIEPEAQAIVGELQRLGIADGLIVTRGVLDFVDLTVAHLARCLVNRPAGTLPKELTVSDDGYERFTLTATTSEATYDFHIVFDRGMAMIGPVVLNGYENYDPEQNTTLVMLLFQSCPEVRDGQKPRS